MPDITLILLAAGCWMVAAVLPFVPPVKEGRLSTVVGALGSLLAFVAALHALLSGHASHVDLRLWLGPVRLEVDALSAAFLLPLHLVAGLGIVFGLEYWPANLAKGFGRSLRFYFGLLVTAITLLFLLRNGLVFLMAWEAMAVSAFFLVATEHHHPEVRHASWIYLVCTHTGTLIITASIILLAHRMGGFPWLPISGAAEDLDGWILLLAVLGFGFKAGLLPLHFWLPAAHASSPSHVSAILSSVMLKTGVYGVLRVSSLLPTVPAWLGGALLALGGLSAVYGVWNALAQRDYKRLLAYSSIENLGIIAMGIGLGWTGRATESPILAALGFGGAIFHVWNHAIFKSLLFFGSGSLLHATGTRDMEALGGLAARMPRTALLLFPAVLAVSALPPFNGFLSEWFLYRGLFASLKGGYPWSAGLALLALVLTGGLAAVAFARFYGTVFLGSPRSSAVDHTHDPSALMLGPMALLAGLTLAMGLLILPLLPVLDCIIGLLAPSPGGLSAGSLAAPLASILGRDLRLLLVLEGLLLALGGLGLAWLGGRKVRAKAPPTWDCGYAAPTARMQYTGSSFADGWALALPGVTRRVRTIRRLFPGPQTFRLKVVDAVGDGMVVPWFGRLAARLLRFRRLQPGFLALYILYLLLALLAVFLWLLVRGRFLA
ncbi:hydrogenase [Geothrix limicola]|uniref:Hydrogenase n=1 Tax=Geothrix limicola TaxID=2927978 RepID=A0ABQ5QJ59_9BACT|nr:proton-conducting transporter membrane subunit [Geothrix limicola]GLH74400.1 hydrogenase [Geothrix limicola]